MKRVHVFQQLKGKVEESPAEERPGDGRQSGGGGNDNHARGRWSAAVAVVRATAASDRRERGDDGGGEGETRAATASTVKILIPNLPTL